MAGTGALMITGNRSAAGGASFSGIAFDAFTIFDPRSIAAFARGRLGDKGDLLVAAWSTRLFGYTWLSAAAGRYRDFDALADASLRVSAESLALAVSDKDRSALVERYAQLDVWPDVRTTLAALRAANLRLVLLSNLGEGALQSNLQRAGIADLFEPPLSTDRVQCFKPAAAAYQMAVEALDLPKAAIGYAAFARWDAAGAIWFGYRTAWINRMNAPAERIGAEPTIVAPSLDGVLALAGLA
jgi:2-haloacid dehalogenase